jgi:hypothetical protein
MGHAEHVVEEVAQDLLLFEAIGLAGGKHLGPLGESGLVGFQRPWQLKCLQMGSQGIRTEQRFGFDRQGILARANDSSERAILAL